jgi:hypothetical protein
MRQVGYLGAEGRDKEGAVSKTPEAQIALLLRRAGRAVSKNGDSLGVAEYVLPVLADAIECGQIGMTTEVYQSLWRALRIHEIEAYE